MSRVGEKLKSARIARGETQSVFSERLGYSIDCVQNVETDRRASRPQTIASMAHALDLDVREVLDLWLADRVDALRRVIDDCAKDWP